MGRRGRHGQPWLVVAAINLLESLLFESLGFIPAWKTVFVAFGSMAAAGQALGAALLAAAALWWGWRAVPPRGPPSAGATA